jgi:3-hydroxybutyrate dehydrogenase
MGRVEPGVTKNAEIDGVINRVIAQQGKLDLMLNNTGLLYVGEYHGMDEALLEQVIAVNVTAVAVGTLYAYRVMKKQGFGQVANVA